MADTLEKIKCPACGKEMEKVYIPSQGINLDICTKGCGGIYFDNREFKYFDEQNEDVSNIIDALSGKTFDAVDTSKTRICPACGSEMVKNKTLKDEIEVDDCYVCGGKFLDNKELFKIREEYENNEQRDADVLKYVYSHVGKELSVLEDKRIDAIEKRTLTQKLFYKIMGLK